MYYIIQDLIFLFIFIIYLYFFDYYKLYNMKLFIFYIIASAILTIIDPSYVLLLLVSFAIRIYVRYNKINKNLFLREFIMGEGFFNLVLCIWFYYYGSTFLELIPILINAGIIAQQTHMESSMGANNRDSNIKQQFIQLINTTQAYVLLYQIVSIFFGKSPNLYKIGFYGFIIKMKYGFNPNLQKVFNNLHIKIQNFTWRRPTLDFIYKIFYRMISAMGRTYISQNKKLGQAANIKKNE